MRYTVNALAQYEVHVARYYYQRGAYVAAVNRAQQAIRTTATPPRWKKGCTSWCAPTTSWA
jgi:outer membrane protein assembly factor BamD